MLYLSKKKKGKNNHHVYFDTMYILTERKHLHLLPNVCDCMSTHMVLKLLDHRELSIFFINDYVFVKIQQCTLTVTTKLQLISA